MQDKKYIEMISNISGAHHSELKYSKRDMLIPPNWNTLFYGKKYSVSSDIEFEELLKFFVKNIKNGLRVEYTIGREDTKYLVPRLIEKERLEIEQYKSEVADLKKKLEAKQENIAKQKERILRDANEQARKVLQEAKDYADQTIRDMNKLAAGKMDNMKEMEQKRSAVRDKLSKTDEKLAFKKEQAKKNRPEDFHPGDSVRVLSMNLKGTIMGKPDSKGKVAVQMGILKSMVSLSDLELLDEEVIKAPTLKKTGAGKIKMNKSATISPSLNIIGQTVDEAMPEVDKYLDDAYLAHLAQVSIIHGRGTGKLRTAVHNKLKKSKYVKSYRLGTFGEGDTGVTIVEFK